MRSYFILENNNQETGGSACNTQLTVMTESVVLLSRDFALLKGGRVEGKSRP